MVKHEQSQEQDNCDCLQILWSIIYLVTGVVNYSVEKTVTWWAMCWPFSSEIQNEWNTRREWINLFINEIKCKTLQLVSNFFTSSILFHKKSLMSTWLLTYIYFLSHSSFSTHQIVFVYQTERHANKVIFLFPVTHLRNSKFMKQRTSITQGIWEKILCF